MIQYHYSNLAITHCLNVLQHSWSSCITYNSTHYTDGISVRRKLVQNYPLTNSALQSSWKR